MVLWITPQAILDLSTFVVAALAIWRGKWEERTVALGLLVDVVATTVFQHTQEPVQALLGGLILDIMYFAILLGAALGSAKWWPLWAAAFQLLGVAFFLARIADPKISPLALATWSYLILIAVVVGIVTPSARATSGPSPSA